MDLLSRILIAGSTLHPRKCRKTAGQDGKVKQLAGAPADALLLFGRHRFTFSGGGGGSDQYVFDSGGGEGRGAGGGAQILAGREASGGGEAVGPGVDYRGSCGNISQTAGGRGLTTAEPQNKHLHGSGSMVWKSGRRTGTVSSAPWPKKPPQKNEMENQQELCSLY